MRIPSDHREALPRPDGAGTPPDTEAPTAEPAQEIGGPAGPPSAAHAPRARDRSWVPSPAGTRPDPSYPDPTRYGDWERNGRCIDF